jgi:hypothetical protein
MQQNEPNVFATELLRIGDCSALTTAIQIATGKQKKGNKHTVVVLVTNACGDSQYFLE